MNTKNKQKYVLLLLISFSILFIFSSVKITRAGGGGCSDECSTNGATQCCDSNSEKTCGDYDADSCLEWSSCSSCNSDGWYDVGSSYSCCDGDSLCSDCQDQQERNYSCSGGSCGYNITGTRTTKNNCSTCDDGNTCTTDSCSSGSCDYELECDGSTCDIGSSDYCSSCSHCGDDTCNCGEDALSCPGDCPMPTSGANLHGYAWSYNTGWISFNCVNENCISSTYGANINTNSGNFEGYAWSSNIGWINFNPNSGYPEPPNHSVQMDLNTNQITGWAKAVNSTSTNEDYGWIKFGYGNTGTYLDSEGKMQGWAWGGGPKKEAVIGWISTQGSNYGVRAKNADPYVTNVTKTEPSASELCAASQGASPAQYNLSWAFNDDNDLIDDHMEAYEVHIENKNGPASATITESGAPASVTTFDITTSENLPSRNLKYGQDYTWELKVQDSSWEKAWSNSTSGEFHVPGRYPRAAFGFEPEEPRVAEPVYFDGSSSTAYLVSSPTTKKDLDLWTWYFDDGDITTTTVATTTHIYNKTGEYEPALKVTDQGGSEDKSCTATSTLEVKPKPGRWEEVIPR